MSCWGGDCFATLLVSAVRGGGMDMPECVPMMGKRRGVAPLQECTQVSNVALWGCFRSISKKRRCWQDAENTMSIAPSGEARLCLQNGPEAAVVDGAGHLVVVGDSHDLHCLHEGRCTAVYALRCCGNRRHRSSHKLARLRFSVAAADTDLEGRFLNHGALQIPVRPLERV